jgi:3-hydroxyacyl-CoA dehydrogenase/enoyl-CoA hydratase/3-hydroxybutyryl-CoA epimerase/enoyl-CoA isomerase
MSSTENLFSGNCIELKLLPEGFHELSVNLKKASVNTFNAETIGELKQALEVLPKTLKGLLVSSGKETFIAGADITEFLGHFKKSEPELVAWITDIHHLFSKIEDLNAPTVCVISGFALGGGLEFALTCDYRIASVGTKIGLPETKLGIFPGWGGTVRLPRLIGMDPAIEWIASGTQYDVNDAFKFGVVDAVVAPADLRAAGIDLLTKCVKGDFRWEKRKEKKKEALPLNKTDSAMAINTNKGGIFALTGTNYPAPMAAFDAIEKSMQLTRDGALVNEAINFAKVAKTTAAAALVGNFLADQAVKKKAKASKPMAQEIKQAAVLGAGIMGGGIAYQSASSKVPILMKDLKPEALQHGMKEAAGLLDKQVQKGKLNALGMADTLSKITATLKQDDLKAAQFVIEAVTENEKIKTSVLKETEATVDANTIIASNTSTISITHLASALSRPEKFCGMHFFNPVPRMPLVEIIRGAKTAPETIATAVQYALTMGKTPIVVNDCPGFLVNRVLFAYFTAFNQLVAEGVDFVKIDKVMEKWGWPMGPAMLLDVVGIDTGNHASEVMQKGFPDRMPLKPEYSVAKMFTAGRFGQKNGKGFYVHSLDAKGKPKKEVTPEAYAVLGQDPTKLNTTITDSEIVDRLMIPFIFESARCLDEKIVDEAYELDLAMLTGLGFPPFRGGPIRYAQSVGVGTLIEKGNSLSKKYGPLYEVTPAIQSALEKATKGA